MLALWSLGLSPSPGGDSTVHETMSYLLLPLLVLAFYFLFMRPMQRVRAANGQRRGMSNSFAIGDQVVTIGGLVGRVVDESGDRLQLEIADGVVIEVVRMAINRRLDPAEGSGFFRSGVEEGEGEEAEEDGEEVGAADEADGADASAAVEDDAGEEETADPGSSSGSPVAGDDGTNA